MVVLRSVFVILGFVIQSPFRNFVMKYSMDVGSFQLNNNSLAGECLH